MYNQEVNDAYLPDHGQCDEEAGDTEHEADKDRSVSNTQHTWKLVKDGRHSCLRLRKLENSHSAAIAAYREWLHWKIMPFGFDMCGY